MPRAKGRNVIAGLDVGTTKICCVIAEWSPVGNLDVIGVGVSPSRGLRKGVVVNIDSTVESIKQAVSDAEEMAGVEVSSVIAGVAGGHIRGVNSRGVVAVSGKHREVNQVDIDRALEAARTINLPQDREIIHVLPQTFLVDDQDGVKEPLGMSGVRLEVEVHLVTGATTSVRNVVRSVNRAGLQVQDIVLEPLASSEAILSAEEKELGILLVDLGGGTTDVALFRDGAVWYTGILPLGGDHISNDIAVGLRTPTADAEELKKRHGCALTALVREDETIDVPSVGGRKARELSRHILSEIIQPRVEEIFTLVARDLARAGLEDVAAAGVVVTGGTCIMHGIPELCEQVFDVPVRRGVPTGLSGLADVVQSPIYATGVGLALYGARGHGGAAPTAPSDGSLTQRVGRRLREWMGDIF
ncbi:MAG TPA: cell division protein FtsA [Methylomirabilota bacterium]|jgi:cell division protein FtsA|nr:cell division protein FtsA [Methylomirabilota bacterium]